MLWYDVEEQFRANEVFHICSVRSLEAYIRPDLSCGLLRKVQKGAKLIRVS